MLTPLNTTLIGLALTGTKSVMHLTTLISFKRAIILIKNKAYIDSQTSEQIATKKGTPTKPGQNSPFRERPNEESLSIFEGMYKGSTIKESMF